MSACQIDNDLITKINISSCGLSSDSLTHVMKGLNAQRRIFTLTLKRMTFNNENSTELAELLA